MTSLRIIVVSHIDTIKGSCFVVVGNLRFVMGLDIGTHCILTMLDIVKILLMQDHAWTVELGDAIFGWEEIELLHQF